MNNKTGGDPALDVGASINTVHDKDRFRGPQAGRLCRPAGRVGQG